ncbi:hypothetical protein BC830DRAFT_1087183 [Chytriomyces sp. MP71]|nr:hypothetical protein BC830DRAFT_1087183 [Chytriomyces sp. MP71]
MMMGLLFHVVKNRIRAWTIQRAVTSDSNIMSNKQETEFSALPNNTMTSCMRTCEPDTQHPGLPCDVTQDRAGCYSFMGVTPKDGFQFVDAANPNVVSVASVSLPPLKTSTSTPVSAASSGVPAVIGAVTVTPTKASMAFQAGLRLGLLVMSVLVL